MNIEVTVQQCLEGFAAVKQLLKEPQPFNLSIQLTDLKTVLEPVNTEYEKRRFDIIKEHGEEGTGDKAGSYALVTDEAKEVGIKILTGILEASVSIGVNMIPAHIFGTIIIKEEQTKALRPFITIK